MYEPFPGNYVWNLSVNICIGMGGAMGEMDKANEEVRRISHQLSSAILQKFGLKAQLEALADVIPDSGKLQVELVTHGLKERLGYQTELQIYRMVQELVHNVIKHAKAKNISIQVNRFENNINLIVEDDGCGFEVEKLSASSGIGMQNLAARMHDLNGKMQIDSRPGRGTRRRVRSRRPARARGSLR